MTSVHEYYGYGVRLLTNPLGLLYCGTTPVAHFCAGGNDQENFFAFCLFPCRKAA